MDLSKTLEQRIAGYAARAGSRAKTRRGQISAAVAHLRGRAARRRAVTPIWIWERGSPTTSRYAMARPSLYETARMYHSARRGKRLGLWGTATDADISAAAERRRAAADPRYRRAQQARLRRATAAWTADSLDAAEWGMADRHARACAAADRLGRLAPSRGDVAPANSALIGIGASRLSDLDGLRPSERRAISPRPGVSWVVTGPWWTTEIEEDQDHLTEWRSGRPRTLESASHEMSIRSYAVIVDDGREIEWAYGPRTGRSVAPSGWSWAIDPDGLRLLSRIADDCDYHPHAAELATQDARDLARTAITAARRRRDLASRAVSGIPAGDVAVWRADSIRAGNCAAGTDAWAARAGMRSRAWAWATEVLSSGGSRAEMAVRAAAERVVRDLARGWTDLREIGHPVAAR